MLFKITSTINGETGWEHVDKDELTATFPGLARWIRDVKKYDTFEVSIRHNQVLHTIRKLEEK